MCREHLRRLAAAHRLPVQVSSVGRWWSADNAVEIDVVGTDGRRTVLAGSAKWARSVHTDELRRLRKAVALTFTAADLYSH